MTQSAIVSVADEGSRLDRWFKRQRGQLPQGLLEKFLRKGLIRVDGRKAKAADRLLAGQEVTWPDVMVAAPPRVRKALTPEQLRELRSWVLYKDDAVIIINKPQGLAVQGGSKVTVSLDDMLDGLMFDAKERPRLIHRIDRDTSGALVLARSAKVAAALARGFAGKTIQKTYWALVCGAPLPPVGTIDLPLAKAARPQDGREQVGVDEEAGKVAITEYRTLEALARKFALMELRPLTGRMHQLRAHMAAIGCPILGDHKYGGSNTDAAGLGVANVLHLHARHISIPGWAGGKAVEVTAPLPVHMLASFDALGLTKPRDK